MPISYRLLASPGGGARFQPKANFSDVQKDCGFCLRPDRIVTLGHLNYAQPVLGTHAPIILDGLVGAAVAVIAGAVAPENWRLVAAEFSGRLAVAIESRLKAEQDGRRAH